jgi:hypothetical protein
LIKRAWFLLIFSSKGPIFNNSNFTRKFHRMKRFMRQNLAKKMQMKVTKNLSNKGFALVDLLVGAALTTTVIAAAGYGLSSMIGASNASSARTQTRVEMNRSLDFITAEIRKSSGIVKDVNSTAATATIPTSFATSYNGIVSGAITKVLMINTTATGSTPIVYFVATPTTGLWKGPRVLYRWGPKFNASGGYDNPGTPSAWVSEALVDNIAANTGTAPACTGTGCGTNGDAGFYSWVDASGKNVQIFQNGKVNKLIGSAETYSVSMNTGSRQTTVTRTYPTISSGASSIIDWTLNGGTVTTNTALTMKLRYLGGDIVCGDPSYPIPTFGSVTLQTGNATPVTTNITMTAGADTTLSNVAANTTMTVSGKGVGNSGSGGCNRGTYGPYSSTNTTQVKSLRNGDSVPQTPGYLGQASIDTYLTSASTNPVTGRPIVNTATHKIDLADNQVIYLFEFGTTDTNSGAFDLQDMVVLATITPDTNTTTTTSSSSTSGKCNNGVGNGSDGCTPGNARANDEPVYDANGNLVCLPAPGNPCTQAAATTGTTNGNGNGNGKGKNK